MQFRTIRFAKRHRFGRFALLLCALLLIGACDNTNKTEDKPTPATGPGLYSGTINVGHLVGICMSPLFLAHKEGYFADEGLDVELVWMPNPGDSVSTLIGGSAQFIHNPFSNTYVAADNGANLKIVGGSGTGGLICIAQPETGVKSLADLHAKANTGLKVGSERINTLELTFYRTIKNLGLDYGAFDMVWFHDHFAMLAGFETKSVDVVTHVEPYATKLIQAGGIPLGDNTDAWGENAPDCVISVKSEFLKKYPETVRRYLRAVLRADRKIKEDFGTAAKILDEGRYYQVDLPTLELAIPRQPPGVEDLVIGVDAMNVAIDDMLELGYIKSVPKDVLDLTILKEVIAETSKGE